MSERGPERPSPSGVDEAVIETRGRPSIVWLIPLVAALVGAFVAWRAIAERGPAITIRFASAEGLEAGKTKVKHKDVEIGLVEAVELDEDLSGVVVHARMVKEFAPYLTEKTRFWVVRARVAGGQVTGLGTIFSGAYLGVDPVREGKRTRRFQGLDVAPIVTTEQEGRQFVLRSYRAGSFAVGTPIFYRKIQVGEVVSSELDPSGEFVTVRVFVHAPYDGRVTTASRFWNASGFDVAMTAEGVRVDTESVASILIGGIAFDTPSDGGELAAAETVFPLYENQEASERPVYTHKVRWLLHFDQSVRGLVPGSPVEFRGIPVGQVKDVKLRFEEDGRIRIPVVVEVEPERFGGTQPEGAARRVALDRLVASGFRAQLKSGNLLTGQLVVALDIHPEAPPAEIDWSGPHPELPTIPTPLEEITTGLTQIVQKLERMPLDEIGSDLRNSLASMAELTRQLNQDVVPRLNDALAQADRTLASANGMVGVDSPVNQELRRALVELTETTRALGLAASQFEREPESVIRGRE